MLYDYGCHSCGEVLKDVYQSIHDEALTKCPTCGKEALERIPHGGIAAFMKHGSNTIGSQADKNWSNMGHYQKSELEAQNKSTVDSNNKKNERKKINNMTQEQKTKYIITGE
tara:strand:- start:235 stop:570 length:336 start_codon:yes stop_codon:yes gene_type:complete